MRGTKLSADDGANMYCLAEIYAMARDVLVILQLYGLINNNVVDD